MSMTKATMLSLKVKFFIFLLFTIGINVVVQAQPTWTLKPFGDEKKPEKYEEKRLASEKTGEKKFTAPRRFITNATTRYNYYFNARQKLDAVVSAAKTAQKDNYIKLLPFYPYSLEGTKAQARELDSIIYIATAAVLLHDLRSDWVDNMYLLIGQSYFLKNDLDSAALTFQFINYNLAPREKDEDDYGRVVGGNGDANGGALSIANKEKQTILQKATGIAPSRNDALIWLTRTHIENESFADAAGLINILEQDRNLPKRLQNDLQEITAYWFYAQKMWDSTAIHLEKALTNATNSEDLSRWEYLLAQLSEKNGDYEKASEYYGKAAKHTTSPILEIYAQLNDAKMLRENGNTKELDAVVARLINMTKKDKYDGYEDILLYSAGELSLRRPDTVNALGLYSKSVTFDAKNEGFRNNAYLKMANISFDQRNYKAAASYYDSLDFKPTEIAELEEDYTERKSILSKMVLMIDVIEKEDSVQMIAALPAAEREDFIRKMVRKYRKDNGLKEEESAFTKGRNVLPNMAGGEPIDLFAPNTKGDWYFYNTNLRGKGFQEFKSRWGKRENIDNWRRKAANIGGFANNNPGAGMGDPNDVSGAGKTSADSSSKKQDYSYEGLMATLPLTKEAVEYSNGKIRENMLSLGFVFLNELEDYPQAIVTFEEYVKRFPFALALEKVYFGLFFAYNKVGDVAKANYYKGLLASRFTGTKEANLATNPELMADKPQSEAVTKRYTEIYNMFLEGNFAAALAAKTKEDTQFGTTYWSPQLLYIESVYYIKERQDSMAIATLNKLVSLYPTSELTAKATTLKEVLGRRASIEKYLTDLEVTRAEEDKIIVATTTPTIQQVTTTVKPMPPVEKKVTAAPIIKAAPAPVPAPLPTAGGYVLDESAVHLVIVVLNKVDPVYVTEARNALIRFNNEGYYTKTLTINKDMVDDQNALLVINKFADADAALAYLAKVKAAAPREMPWLPASKYSFYIITEQNINVLKDKKDLPVYKTLLNAKYNNIF